MEYTPLSAWWGSTAVFDPRVIYDPFTDRYYACAVRAGRSANSSVLVRVSNSGNPLGATNAVSTWTTLIFDVDITDTVWADCPTIGFNKNRIAVQCNFFEVSDDDFVRSEVDTYTKSTVVGGAFPSPVIFNLAGAGATQQPAVTFDNASEDLYFVNVANPAQGWLGVE